MSRGKFNNICFKYVPNLDIYITSLSNQETFTGAAKMLNRLLLGNANAITQ